VTDGVLPALLRLPIERKLVHDELVDLAERTHLERRRLTYASTHTHIYILCMHTCTQVRLHIVSYYDSEVPKCL